MNTNPPDQSTDDFLSLVDDNRMIRRVGLVDWKQQWDIHLDALKTDPDSFKGSYEYCSNISDQEAKDFTEKTAISETQSCFLAWANNIAIAEIYIQLRSPDSAHISIMWVSPDFREGAIGTKLMVIAEQWAKGQNPDLTNFDLVVQPANHEAIGFYEKHGYEASIDREGEETLMTKHV